MNPFSLKQSAMTFLFGEQTTNGTTASTSISPPLPQKILPSSPPVTTDKPSPPHTPIKTVDPKTLETPSPSPKRKPPDSAKKLVQFIEDVSSDENDDDYRPNKKRKQFTEPSSPRHTSKGLLNSPKKINRDQLLNRKAELDMERRKLPIWSGIFPSIRHLI
jgi:hypothetical protein